MNIKDFMGELRSFILAFSSLWGVTACSNISDIRDIFRPTTARNTVRVIQHQPEVSPQQKQENIAHTQTAKLTTKRINTAQCNDSDDWYLDGYRVGYSFSSQKVVMLQERIGYCQFPQLPTHLKANWEQGYKQGYYQAKSKHKSHTS